MKTITKEQWTTLQTRNCDKGKHRLRTNKYGVTWCVICGRLSNSFNEEDLKEEDKITIKCD